MAAEAGRIPPKMSATSAEGFKGHLDMTAGTIIIAILIGAAASLAGGAVGGMLVGGKDLGVKLAAIMGAFYGILGGLPGVIAGLALIIVSLMISAGSA
jgi:hypothetical protein